MKKFMMCAGIILILLSTIVISNSLQDPQESKVTDTKKVMVVIIDGARYSETFGDPTHTYIPEMWGLSQEGTVIDNFYNDSLTYTSRALPALWCGIWTEVRDTFYQGHQTLYSVKPSIWEYYRKQKNMPAEECFYVLEYVESLWLPSFDSSYGPAYWPMHYSAGSSDDEVGANAEWILDNHHPHFIWVYFADVDHAGHSGNWESYTTAIHTADSIVGFLWEKLQADTFYKNSTTLFVTNDHGRHDDQHGGFSGHGDGCEGCRHIMFLALGPDIKNNFVSAQYRKTPDLAVTISEIFDVDPTEATGEIMNEIFEPTSIQEQAIPLVDFYLNQNYPNPFNPGTTIKYQIPELSFVIVKVYDVLGGEVATLVNEEKLLGNYEVEFDGIGLSSGIYFYQLKAGNYLETKKMVVIK
jgi:hypothetical protein